jgi:hypothetical protein
MGSKTAMPDKVIVLLEVAFSPYTAMPTEAAQAKLLLQSLMFIIAANRLNHQTIANSLG